MYLYPPFFEQSEQKSTWFNCKFSLQVIIYNKKIISLIKLDTKLKKKLFHEALYVCRDARG